jgi:cell division protein FtsB
MPFQRCHRKEPDMDPATLLAILSALLTSLGGTLALSDFSIKLLGKLFRKKFAPSGKTYSERLATLTGSLTKASAEVDSVLQEMVKVTAERERSVQALEAGLANLEKTEKELKEKIALLQSVPIPVAEQFAKLVAPAEKKSARRDYVLFLAGVVASTVIAIVLKRVFGI